MRAHPVVLLTWLASATLLAACEPEPRPCDIEGQAQCVGSISEVCDGKVWQEDADCAAESTSCDETTGRCYVAF